MNQHRTTTIPRLSASQPFTKSWPLVLRLTAQSLSSSPPSRISPTATEPQQASPPSTPNPLPTRKPRRDKCYTTWESRRTRGKGHHLGCPRKGPKPRRNAALRRCRMSGEQLLEPRWSSTQIEGTVSHRRRRRHARPSTEGRQHVVMRFTGGSVLCAERGGAAVKDGVAGAEEVGYEEERGQRVSYGHDPQPILGPLAPHPSTRRLRSSAMRAW